MLLLLRCLAAKKLRRGRLSGFRRSEWALRRPSAGGSSGGVDAGYLARPLAAAIHGGSIKMYRKRSEIALKASSSLLSGNMAASRTGASDEAIGYAYAHKSAVHLVLRAVGQGHTHQHVSCKIPTANQQSSPVVAMQVDWVNVSGRKILVVATQKGVQMYDADGSALIHWHPFNGPDEAESRAISFTRGICGIGNSVCVGASTGEILVFKVPAHGINITFEESIQGHVAPVAALACSRELMASSDEGGGIVLWHHHGDGNFKQIAKIPGYGSPCSCLALWQNLLVAGYGSGHLRIFSTDDVKAAGQRWSLRIEVAAHARWINGLAVAPQNGLCLTVSEDTFARVWQLHSGPEPAISLVFSTSVADTQLVGCCFTRGDGSGFATTGYDRTEIQVFEC